MSKSAWDVKRSVHYIAFPVRYRALKDSEKNFHFPTAKGIPHGQPHGLHARNRWETCERLTRNMRADRHSQSTLLRLPCRRGSDPWRCHGGLVFKPSWLSWPSYAWHICHLVIFQILTWVGWALLSIYVSLRFFFLLSSHEPALKWIQSGNGT